MWIFCSIMMGDRPITSQDEATQAVRELNPDAEPPQDEGEGCWTANLGAEFERKLDLHGDYEVTTNSGFTIGAEMP